MSPFWRRQETLNERLRREAAERRATEDADDEYRLEESADEPDADYAHSSHGQGVFTQRGLIVPSPGDHDAIVVVEAREQTGTRIVFVTLPDGSLLLEEGDLGGEATRIAGAVEDDLRPPYRACAELSEGTWVVAVDAVELVALEADIDGDTVEIAVTDGGRTVTVDGTPSPTGAPELESYGDSRFLTYFLRAERLDENVWEVEVTPV